MVNFLSNFFSRTADPNSMAFDAAVFGSFTLRTQPFRMETDMVMCV